MTLDALRAMGRYRTGAQNNLTLSSTHITLAHSRTNSFNDQEDEPDLELLTQLALKQSRLMIWTDRRPYKWLIGIFTAITFMVLLTLIFGRLMATGLPRDHFSYQGSRISPESLLYCMHGLVSKVPYMC